MIWPSGRFDSLLDLEDGRELLLADETELGHQLAELTLWHAFPFRTKRSWLWLDLPQGSHVGCIGA